MIIMNIYWEWFVRMNFAPTAGGAKELSLYLDEKQSKTQKQSYKKEHNKQLRFHGAGIMLMTRISFHSTFTRKPYLRGKNYLKLVAMKAYLNYFDGRNSFEKVYGS